MPPSQTKLSQVKSSQVESEERFLVLFDGSCNLCNSSVQFIMKHDSRGRFAFVSSRTPEGSALAAQHGFAGPTPGSMVLVVGERAYTRSTASLQIARRLDGIWPVLYAFIVIPRPLRDLGYRLIAANRHRWFGVARQCVAIPPERRMDEPAKTVP
jgi:predicted DCC family thiol-disulfide oxidoreductase YuxK